MMIKGTYKKRQFTPNVYLLAFEPTTRAEEIVAGLIDILNGTTENLVIRQREYNGEFAVVGNELQFKIENVFIRYEFKSSSKKSDIVRYMEDFDKVLKCNYHQKKELPIRYNSNLHRGGKENGNRVDARLLIVRTV
jgi:hypothetical protein